MFSLIGGLAGVLLSGLHRTIWRFPSVSDVWRISLAVLLSVLVTTSLTFAYNRLEGTPRALPPLHACACMFFLTFGRLLAQARHRQRMSLSTKVGSSPAQGLASTATLVIGLNSVASSLIRAAVEFGSQQKVVGVIAERPRQVGRVFQGLRVVGVVDDLLKAIDDFAVQGIVVNRVAVCVPRSALPRGFQDHLSAVARV
jgi:FlaA1/EpsC-like NDP-sugar epimerase